MAKKILIKHFVRDYIIGDQPTKLWLHHCVSVLQCWDKMLSGSLSTKYMFKHVNLMKVMHKAWVWISLWQEVKKLTKLSNINMSFQSILSRRHKHDVAMCKLIHENSVINFNCIIYSYDMCVVCIWKYSEENNHNSNIFGLLAIWFQAKEKMLT